MTPKALTITKAHLHPLRFNKKHSTLEISDEQITIMASNIVRGAEESIRHELRSMEDARILSLIRSSFENDPEA